MLTCRTRNKKLLGKPFCETCKKFMEDRVREFVAKCNVHPALRTLDFVEGLFWP
jgi:hypothetical protein